MSLPHRESLLKPLFIKKLDLVILFVTSICNARCRTCFYWLELNHKGDLTFEELSKLSSTMPKFADLWISGGEPFLRKELAKIIELFYINNHIRDIRIPTNGLPTAQTLQVVTEILDKCPELHLEVDVSIDGFGETHDRIRGVPGNFTKALTTIRELQALRPKWPNFTLYVNSVITQENQNEIVDLAQFFEGNSELDGHYFQIIRGDPKDPKLQGVEPKRLKQIYNEVLPINGRYISKIAQIKSWPRALTKAYWQSGYDFSYQTQYRNYSERATWKMPCTAGQTSMVIDYNGDVRVCELRKPIGNLRKHGMDFQRFWNSTERRLEVKQVGLDKCFCTHICFMYDSMRHSKRVMLWELPLMSLKRNLKSVLARGKTTTPERVESKVLEPLAAAPQEYRKLAPLPLLRYEGPQARDFAEAELPTRGDKDKLVSRAKEQSDNLLVN
jgi:MoaA/NifB/PqqE/SkfB family radical SAM enzyme